MENEDEFDVRNRTEAMAPNLRPVQYIDEDNYVCCSQISPPIKAKLCEATTNYPKIQPMHCFYKNRPHAKSRLKQSKRNGCEKTMKVKTKPLQPSLGSPIGLSKSSISMHFLESKSSEQSLQGFATILIAYAMYFISPEIEWDERVINQILLDGQQLYCNSKTELPVDEQANETTIKRSFKLHEHTFDVLVQDPFLIGRVKGKELPVPNLQWGLLKFFKKYNFCLLQIGSWYTLIWKNFGVYFVFDCFGRRSYDLQRDQKLGKAMLICLRSLDNVSHLVINLSSIQPEQAFTIRQLTIRSFIACGGEPLPDIVDRSMEFEIVSPDYALLRGTIHLGSSCFKEISNRQSLPVAICALLNAKIDPTPTWNGVVVDKIIKLGAQMYKHLTRRDITMDLGIQNVPTWLEFGQFRVKIELSTVSNCGLWKCTPNYKRSELTLALKAAFENGSNLLIQIQGRTYAVWKKKAFYYIMDPYSHQTSLEGKKLVTASVRMCGNFDRVCCTITQALLDIFEESKFLIHLMRISQVEEIDPITQKTFLYQVACKCHLTSLNDCIHEVASLNESVTCLDDFYCAKESSPVVSDVGDLDSPSLSQTHLDDYMDLRRQFAEESSEESEDEEDESDIDDDVTSVHMTISDKSDKDDDDDVLPVKNAANKKEKKKSKNDTKKEKKSKNSGSVSDTKNNTKRDNKLGYETLDDAADDEMEKEQPKRKDKNKKNNDKNDKGKDKPIFSDDEMEKGNEIDRDTNPEKRTLDQNQKHDVKIDTKFTKDRKLDETLEKGEKADKSSEKEKNIDKITENPVKTSERDEVTPEIDQDKSKTNDDENHKSIVTNGERTNKIRETTDVSTSTNPEFLHQLREAQDHDETLFDESTRARIPSICKPNCYPGKTKNQQDLAVVGSESGSYESLCVLLKSGFRCADRVLTMTPWGNYVAFHIGRAYFIFDGCTCNVHSIRHMELSVGTAGLLYFSNIHSLIRYIEVGKEATRPTNISKRNLVDEICSEYCPE